MQRIPFRRLPRRLALSAALLAAAVSLASPAASAAQTTGAAGAGGALAGTVRTSAGGPVAGAAVRLTGTTRSTTTDTDGAFRLERLAPGEYLLEVESARFGTAAAAVVLAAGETATLEVVLDLSVHAEEVVVTTTAEAAALADVAQPIGVLAGDELAAASRGSLGETLATQPGVSATSFGAGASRPIIRGQGGNRVRILENGVGSGDASNTSPDHAVALEPLAAEKIEVVRGPATLLYGSNAIGGVVNLLDDRIPDHLPGAPITGIVSLGGGSNAEERSGAADLSGELGSFAWRAAGFRREADDYEAGGGFAASGSDRVPNSDVESEGGSLGVSWVGDDGYAGVSAGRYDSNYGNPAEEEVRLDLQQRRYDLHAGTHRPLGVLEGVRLRVGLNDYEHSELEGAEVGTVFRNDFWEARLDSGHAPLGAFRGSFGVQVSAREFEAIGEEAFVPPTDNESWAVFLFEEVGSGPLRGQLGLRHERQDSTAVGRPDRSFSGTSASAGALWDVREQLQVAVTVSRSVKLPDPEELYADGPHIATGVFEIGDPDLDEETTLGVDLTLRHRTERVRTELSVYRNRTDDYIFDRFTGEVVGGEDDEHEEPGHEEGEEEDGHGHGEEPLPVVRFVQDDAEFWGAEAQVHLELLHAEPHHLELELGGDLVRAELRRGGEPLPRIPPSRYSAGLRYQGDRLSASVFARRIEEQDRVARFETPTSGYTTLDAGIGWRFFVGDTVHSLRLAGSNLTDELARNHVSYLKDVAPLPGRDVRLTYRLGF
jgi:iron complex outermembrane receptor protein